MLLDGVSLSLTLVLRDGALQLGRDLLTLAGVSMDAANSARNSSCAREVISRVEIHRSTRFDSTFPSAQNAEGKRAANPVDDSARSRNPLKHEQETPEAVDHLSKKCCPRCNANFHKPCRSSPDRLLELV